MFFRQIVDPGLAQNAYLIGCQRTGEALLIDPERDVDRYLDLAAQEGLDITAVAETHIHADFLSGSRELASRKPVRLYLSNEGPADWKYHWAKTDDYDVRLLEDGDTFRVGNIELRVLHTPGHTPEHLSYLVTDLGGGAKSPMGIVSGDFLFVGDLGRPDLLDTAAGSKGTREPAARALFESVGKLLELPDYLQVWPGHGAGSACGKALGAVPISTLGYEKLYNASIEPARKGADEFVANILDAQPEPPLYFGRMKILNKEGPVVLGELPAPLALTTDAFEKLGAGAVVVDTRADRDAFLRAHLPGSLFAPLGSSLPVAAGSYVDPSEKIVLIASEEDVEAAVRGLIRIGLDDIVGYLTPSALESAQGGLRTASTPSMTFAEARNRLAMDDTVLLDVRGEAEYRTAHVPGALNIAYTRLLPRQSEIPQGKTILVHCQSGRRAAFAASMLERMGHEVVHIDDDFDRFSAAA